jgi:uncharacterized protein YdhG (YjbR/CyaY superfamily)
MKTVDEYLAGLPVDQRAALQMLREIILDVAPQAEETISYGVHVFKLRGHLVSFGAAAKHCAFYPMSGTLVADFAEALKGFSTSKGTIRFQPAKPIPEAVVRAMVGRRVTENEAARR